MEDKPTNQGLSMEALMSELGNTAEFSDLRQKVSKIEKSKVYTLFLIIIFQTKVSAALPKTQREKLERKVFDQNISNMQVAYEDAKGTVSLWSGIVNKNRQEEFLRFDDSASGKFHISDSELAAKFQPTTEMEKEIDIVCSLIKFIKQILEKSEMKEKKVKEKESRDLEMNKLSIDDVKQRNNELSKMKSLLFYQEQKNKRINKIKSKKYHKIHKKAEERRKEKEREVILKLIINDDQLIKQTDPALYKELLEKDAIKRAKERMSLKHKNTSKVFFFYFSY